MLVPMALIQSHANQLLLKIELLDLLDRNTDWEKEENAYW